MQRRFAEEQIIATLDAVADRGYFSSEQILACEQAGITVALPKPMTSHSNAEGRFGKQDFRYLVEEGVYVCLVKGSPTLSQQVKA